MDQPQQPTLDQMIQLLGLTFPKMKYGPITTGEYLKDAGSTLKFRSIPQEYGTITPTTPESLPVLLPELYRRILSTAGGIAPVTSQTLYRKEYREQTECWSGISLLDLIRWLNKRPVGYSPGSNPIQTFCLMIITGDMMNMNSRISSSVISCSFTIGQDSNIITHNFVIMKNMYLIESEINNRVYRLNEFIESILMKIGTNEGNILSIIPDIYTYGSIILDRKSCGIYDGQNTGIYAQLYTKMFIEDSTYFMVNPLLMLHFLFIMSIDISENNTPGSPLTGSRIGIMIGETIDIFKTQEQTTISLPYLSLPRDSTSIEDNMINKIKEAFILRFSENLANIRQLLGQYIYIEIRR